MGTECLPAIVAGGSWLSGAGDDAVDLPARDVLRRVSHPGRSCALRTDGDPEALGRAAHGFGDHLLHLFLSPAEATFLQPADRPFQCYFNDDVRIPGGVRHAAE